MENKKRIMIIGAGGSLGSELCRILNTEKYHIIGIDRCENRLAYINRIFGTKTYLIDVEETEILKDIIEENRINVVVNTAAMKHVLSCENRIKKAIEINILANLKLVEYLKKKNKEFIYISSDKAIKPKNVYALTKQFTDYIVKNNEYKVVRGVNFLYSKGSVIDIWERQRILNVPFTVVKEDCFRYFITITQMAELVKSAIEDLSGKLEFVPPVVYNMGIHALFFSYLKLFDIDEYINNPINITRCEKTVEDLDFDTEIIELNKQEDIMKLLSECFKHYQGIDQNI